MALNATSLPEPTLVWSLTIDTGVTWASGPLLAIDPTGRMLAMGGAHGVTLIDVASQRHRQLQGRRVFAVAWSLDGRLVSAGAEGLLCLWKPTFWDPAPGEVLAQVEPGGQAHSVAWSPDGTRVIAGYQFGPIRTWDFEDLVDATSDRRTTWKLAVASDGRLARGTYEGTLEIFDRSVEGEPRTLLDDRGQDIFDVSWSARADQLASASKQQLVQIWDPNSGQLLRTLDHADEVRTVKYSPDGQMLASGSFDQTLRLWDSATGAALHTLHHDRSVIAIDWMPDGTQLVTVDDGATVRLWQIHPPRASGRLGSWVSRQAASVGRVAESPEVWVPDLPTRDGALLGQFAEAEPIHDPPDEQRFTGLAWFPPTRQLAEGAMNGDIRIRDLGLGQIVRTLKVGTRIAGLSWSPDGHRLAAVSNDQTLTIWDIGTGELVHRIQAHTHQVFRVAWSPDGAIVATGARACPEALRLWDPTTGTMLASAEAQLSSFGFAWNPEGQWLASGNSGHVIDVVDRRGAIVAKLTEHDGIVYDVAWSPDGHKLASCNPGADDVNGRVIVWDVARRTMLLDFEPDPNVYALAWSPDGRHLAYSCGQRVHVRTLSTGQEPLSFDAPGGIVSRLIWDPGGGVLIGGASGEIVWLWDTRPLLDEVASPRRPHGPLAPNLRQLPRLLAAMHRMGLHPPLSLLADWLALTAGHPPRFHPALSELAEPLRPLTALGWPADARAALLPVVLEPARAYDPESLDDPPPTGTRSSEVRKALVHALAGEPRAPGPPPIGPGALQRAATDALTGTEADRLLTLLQTLGPGPFAADPTLFGRIREDLPAVVALTPVERRLLVGALDADRRAGIAQTIGVGSGRTGLAHHGPTSTLLHTQLGLPDDLFAFRLATSSLLFRARATSQPPRLRPLVLVLDASPATWGPVERVLRTAGLALLSANQQADLPVRLLILGGSPTAVSTDLRVSVLTARRSRRVELGASLAVARAMAAQLAGDGSTPAVVLLGHARLGAEQPGSLPHVPGLTGLFVSWPGPGHMRTPPLADRCARWRRIGCSEADRLPEAIASLLL